MEESERSACRASQPGQLAGRFFEPAARRRRRNASRDADKASRPARRRGGLPTSPIRSRSAWPAAIRPRISCDTRSMPWRRGPGTGAILVHPSRRRTSSPGRSPRTPTGWPTIPRIGRFVLPGGLCAGHDRSQPSWMLVTLLAGDDAVASAVRSYRVRSLDGNRCRAGPELLGRGGRAGRQCPGARGSLSGRRVSKAVQRRGRPSHVNPWRNCSARAGTARSAPPSAAASGSPAFADPESAGDEVLRDEVDWHIHRITGAGIGWRTVSVS